MLALSLAISLSQSYEYKVFSVEGWKVSVRIEIANEKSTTKALNLLKGQLEFIKKTLPKGPVSSLQSVKLFFSPNYAGKRGGGEYHPGRQWLVDNGRDPDMALGIEFSDLKNFDKESKRMPAFALHELSHAFHHQFVKDGYENDLIKHAWVKAVESGKYDRVERKDHAGRASMDKAYALTNPQEYFAELTEAFFSINDFYPYNREQLKKFDPTGYSMVNKIWNSTK